MTKTREYKIEKIGMYWYVTQLHYVGWWIFKKELWLIDSTGYWRKKDADNALSEILNCT